MWADNLRRLFSTLKYLFGVAVHLKNVDFEDFLFRFGEDFDRTGMFEISSNNSKQTSQAALARTIQGAPKLARNVLGRWVEKTPVDSHLHHWFIWLRVQTTTIATRLALEIKIFSIWSIKIKLLAHPVCSDAHGK